MTRRSREVSVVAPKTKPLRKSSGECFWVSEYLFSVESCFESKNIILKCEEKLLSGRWRSLNRQLQLTGRKVGEWSLLETEETPTVARDESVKVPRRNGAENRFWVSRVVAPSADVKAVLWHRHTKIFRTSARVCLASTCSSSCISCRSRTFRILRSGRRTNFSQFSSAKFMGNSEEVYWILAALDEKCVFFSLSCHFLIDRVAN